MKKKCENNKVRKHIRLEIVKIGGVNWVHGGCRQKKLKNELILSIQRKKKHCLIKNKGQYET